MFCWHGRTFVPSGNHLLLCRSTQAWLASYAILPRSRISRMKASCIARRSRTWAGVRTIRSTPMSGLMWVIIRAACCRGTLERHDDKQVKVRKGARISICVRPKHDDLLRTKVSCDPVANILDFLGGSHCLLKVSH